MLKPQNIKLLCNENLSSNDIDIALKYMLNDDIGVQSSAFLSLLKAKGESIDEIYDITIKLKSLMESVKIDQITMDIVGTGGDGYNTINISTASAILSAACGVKVTKHGNRSVSSLCGSADLLEELGVNINSSNQSMKDCLNKTNFGFLFAPNYHPTLKKIKQLRKRIGFPTIFNLIGPLLNPTNCEYIMLGVSDLKYLDIISEVALKLKFKKALIFHGCGLDEISTLGNINIVEINSGFSRKFTLNPKLYGFNYCSLDDLKGGSPAYNAKVVEQALKGHQSPLSDTIILNAAMANYLYGICENIESGINHASETLKSGIAYQTLGNIKYFLKTH